MALVALIFSEGAFAQLFVAFDARAVESRHAVGDKIGCFLPHMARLTLGEGRVNGSLAGVVQDGTHVDLGVARGAALHLFVEKVLVAGGALAVYRTAEGRHAFISRFFMAGGAILRFGFNAGIFVVALAAIDAKVFAVLVVPPLGGLEFHVVAGNTGGERGNLRGVVLLERLVKGDAVAGTAGQHVLLGGGVFVVAGLALYLVFGGMHFVVKNNLASCVVQENACRYGGGRGGDDIAHEGYQSHTAYKNGDGKIAFLQECPSLKFE